MTQAVAMAHFIVFDGGDPYLIIGWTTFRHICLIRGVLAFAALDLTVAKETACTA